MMKFQKIIAIVFSIFYFNASYAGVYEIGGSFSWSRSNYNAGSYTWSRAYGASFGYYFTQDSQLQFGYEDKTTKTFDPGRMDINYRDRVYSINFVYYMMSEESRLRPFVKLGVAQLNRDATGTYAGGYAPAGRLDQLSVIGGFGIKYRVTERVSIKTEATTYLTGGAIGSWQDNLSFSFGGAFYF